MKWIKEQVFKTPISAYVEKKEQSLFTDATVTFTMEYYVGSESSGFVQVCAQLDDIPSGGLECNITAKLDAVNGKAGM